MRVTLRASAAISTADSGRRTLSGTLFRYGEVGLTSAGPLRVRPGAIQVPANLASVPLVRDHDDPDQVQDAVRGHLAMVDDNAERMYVVLKVDDGVQGDAALAEAADPDRVRAGLSYYIEDIEFDDDGWVAKARLVHIGQVEEPAYNSARIDRIAASRTAGASRTNTEGDSMNPEQIARLAELRAKTDRTPEEEAELQQLVTMAVDQVTSPQASATEPAGESTEPVDPTATATEPVQEPEPAAASMAPVNVTVNMPPVPSGIPSLGAAASIRPQGENAFDRMISGLVQAFQAKKRGGDPMPGITAALNDVTGTAHTSDVEPLAWSGELFSGVAYESVFSKNLTPGPLDNWKGQGWRFTQTPSMQDYAGDKAAIPTGTVGTEESLYEAARAAVGLDIDRKYFDFPNGDFLASLFRAIAETWDMLVDQKSGLFITSEAVFSTRKVTVATTNADATVTAPAGAVAAIDVGQPITGTGIPAGTTVLSITDATHFEMSANATATQAAVVVEIGVKAPSLLKAAARVSGSLKKRRNNRPAPTATGPDYIYVNDEDWYGLMDLVELELPVYLSAYGVKPETFIPDESIPSGFVIGGVKKAAKLRTEGRSPIAVDALNLANGGIDKAFFGYWAIEQEHLFGIQKVAFDEVVEA